MKSRLFFNLAITVLMALIALLFYLFSIPCPSKFFFSVPCPTCGMTRSIVSLLRLDLCSSFYYNPLTIPFGVLLLFGIYKDLFRLSKKTVDTILIIGSIVIFIVYLIRLMIFDLS